MRWFITLVGKLLRGVRELTVEQAEELAKYEDHLYLVKGDLSLDGLTKITPEVAEALAKHEGGLSLNSLTKITPEALKMLRANPEIRLP